ncbi:CAAX protease family protein [Streptococcus cuniculi]|uniref:CAAX protease family protein n=1 Tax=Streptococcus cuniculi TaxID=1432788 RepID=A0A1Q8E7X0_9STRE|nr:type II CAAX endopeptidase family protein [Streptococcus cuniculi]OLF47889.1 CAAX protease family protein [Streptococcus cuniculi]
MEQNRMFAAIRIHSDKKLNWLYAFLLPFIVQLVLDIGFIVAGYVGYIAQDFSIADFVYSLFYVLDPVFLKLLPFSGAFILILLWVRVVEKRPISGLGFYKKHALKELLKGLGVGILLISAVVAAQCLTGAIELTATYFSGLNFLNFLLIFPLWFLQSATEELSTRGWLFPGVARRTSLPIGILVSSVLFSLLHLGNNAISWISLLNIALFGLFACLYVLKTDNIWGVSAVHAAWNCFQGTVFGINVSGISVSYSLMGFSPTSAPDYLSGGEFGSEGSIFASIVLAIGCAYLAWALHQKRAS